MRNRVSLYLFIALVYYAVYAVLLYAICYLKGDSDLFRSFSFAYYDSVHFENIKTLGYRTYLTAFFPGFPLFWKALCVNGMGISLINGLLFCTSLSVFASKNNWDTSFFMSILVLPSLLFMFLPYSESLFFLFAVIFLIGLKGNHRMLLLAGLYGCSITRPTVAVFLPALLIVQIGFNDQMRKGVGNFVLSSISILGGLLTSLYVHYLGTGEWTLFFSAQKDWGNWLRLPTFPLSSWSDSAIVITDGICLWISLMCGIAFLLELRNRIRGSKDYDAVYLLSLLYVAGTGLFVLLFRGGMLFSLNRFIFATPFILVVLWYAYQKKLTRNYFLAVSYSFLPFSLLLGSYVHIQNLMKFVLVTLAIAFVVRAFFAPEKRNLSFYWMAVSLMLLVQLYFGVRIIEGDWIG